VNPAAETGNAIGSEFLENGSALIVRKDESSAFAAEHRVIYG
jgi:hypothetical protein